MSAYNTFGIIHCALLLTLSFLTSRRFVGAMAARVCATAILVWSNIVTTSLLLSCFSQLGNNSAYFALSAGISLGVLWWSGRAPRCPETKAEPPTSALKQWSARTLLLLLVAFGSASLAIALTHTTNNGDSLSYRYSRAVFYISQGNLLHFGPIGDPRYLFYPFNGTLLYIFCARYHFGDLGFRLISLVAWSLSGVGIYATTRALLADRTSALFAVTSGLLAPSVLAQATSTNDEIVLASAALCTLPLAVEWFRTKRLSTAILAGAGAGVALGTKLHWYFYWPIIPALALVGLVYFVRNPLLGRELIRRFTPGLVAMLLPAFALSVPFIAANLISAHKVTDSYFNNLVLNKPFRGQLAVEKVQVNTGQLFLSSVPDLIPSRPGTNRLPIYEKFNKATSQLLFRNITECRKIGPEGYRFLGAASVNAEYMEEYTVGYGPLPWLMIGLLGLGIFRPKLPMAAWLFLGSFFAWHLSYSMHMKYIDGYLPYYAFSALLACVGIGPAILHLGKRHRDIAVAVIFVATVLQTVLGSNLLLHNAKRNLGYIATKSNALNQQIVAPAVTDYIRSRHEIRLTYQFWNQAFWPLMRQNPSAKFSLGPLGGETLGSIPQLFYAALPLGNSFKIPVALPSTVPGGSVHLGYACGGELFAYEADATAPADQRRFAIADISIIKAADGTWKSIQFSGSWMGGNNGSSFEYRFALAASASAPDPFTPWTVPGIPTPVTPPHSGEAGHVLIVEVRATAVPDTICRTEIRTESGTPGIPAYSVEYSIRQVLSASEPAK